MVLMSDEKPVGKHGYDKIAPEKAMLLQKRRLDYKDRKLHGGEEGQDRISVVCTEGTKH